MEIIENPKWRALPTELAHRIAEFTGCFKLRKGVIVQQITKDDPRRRILNTIPKIVISSYNDGDDKIIISKVESQRQICTSPFGQPVKFEICSESRNPARGYWVHHLPNGDTSTTIDTYGIYREIQFSFGWDEIPCFGRNWDRVIIQCDGTATNVNE